ncbi:RecQ family ATP-dependent DNA helicase [archaeon]|jgi:ATP-dependent DNA helicase RecQ|nr:RecQ family ATP-dependent DNA helicase [archaeon]MBT4397112.1 RecQ family ATP-dependent DNA helicase [archaeon]MBT4441582.1 RecQ family ATP-dependent DNA helicase [archaeon]
MQSLLKRYFGYDDFRPKQLEIINNILEKRDSLVLMPTGGGKSICFQIPSLKMDGLAIVISPLISLMKDQVDNLNANGVPAAYINSSLTYRQMEEIKEKARKNEIKLLYIAPERLALEPFKVFLMTLNINLIAIDEAHCISEWGHNFRKEYRNLKNLKILFPNLPIVALTATATQKVKEDILKQLGLDKPQIFTSSFDRKNLKLIVAKKKNSFNKILSLLKKNKDNPAIIYCFSRKDTENLALKLRERGFSALPYHAGLPNAIRKQNQDQFIKDKVNIIVATIAFGMGIDKPDVRLIIHHTFSKSLEGYYQEIGRAGRDGLPSECVLFYSYGDKRKHDFFIDKMHPSPAKGSSVAKLDKMIEYCEGFECRRKTILEYFGEIGLEECTGCDFCLKLPELEGVDSENVVKFKRTTEKTYDKRLFEKLRRFRKIISEERNVPPFIIFGDVSLREMALYYPRTRDEMLKIKGVGQQKLRDFGDRFIREIKLYVEEYNIILKKFEIKKRVKQKSLHAYDPWVEDEDQQLTMLFSANKPIREISLVLNRTPSAVRERLRMHRLIY